MLLCQGLRAYRRGKATTIMECDTYTLQEQRPADPSSTYHPAVAHVIATTGRWALVQAPPAQPIDVHHTWQQATKTAGASSHSSLPPPCLLERHACHPSPVPCPLLSGRPISLTGRLRMETKGKRHGVTSAWGLTAAVLPRKVQSVAVKAPFACIPPPWTPIHPVPRKR